MEGISSSDGESFSLRRLTQLKECRKLSASCSKYALLMFCKLWKTTSCHIYLASLSLFSLLTLSPLLSLSLFRDCQCALTQPLLSAVPPPLSLPPSVALSLPRSLAHSHSTLLQPSTSSSRLKIPFEFGLRGMRERGKGKRVSREGRGRKGWDIPD